MDLHASMPVLPWVHGLKIQKYDNSKTSVKQSGKSQLNHPAVFEALI